MATEVTLWCSKCKQDKHPSEFYVSSNANYCKECMKKYQMRRYNGDPVCHANNRMIARHRIKTKKFNITMQQRRKLLAKQKGCWPICAKKLSSSPATDHCHVTGVVRGILCGTCNRALGLFHEDIDSLKRAIRYLRKHRRTTND